MQYTQEYGDDLFRMRLCHENANMYAIGGKGQGRDLKIFDISSKEPVFKAKNVCLLNVYLGEMGHLRKRDRHFFVLRGIFQICRVCSVFQERKISPSLVHVSPHIHQVSNDMVDLQVPIWIHDLAFVPGSQGSKIVTVTAHRHVRWEFS